MECAQHFGLPSQASEVVGDGIMQGFSSQLQDRSVSPGAISLRKRFYWPSALTSAKRPTLTMGGWAAGSSGYKNISCLVSISRPWRWIPPGCQLKFRLPALRCEGYSTRDSPLFYTQWATWKSTDVLFNRWWPENQLPLWWYHHLATTGRDDSRSMSRQHNSLRAKCLGIREIVGV